MGHNFLNTAWILTKILLDIDIDGFSSNIVWFFHDGLILVLFSMFLWSPPFPNYTNLRFLGYSRTIRNSVMTSSICKLDAIFSNREFEQEGKTPFHFKFSFLNFSAITASFQTSFWQLVDNNYIFHMPGRQPPAPPKSRDLNRPEHVKFHHVQKHDKSLDTRNYHLKHPAPFPISINIHNLCQRIIWNKQHWPPCSISPDTWSGTWAMYAPMCPI